MQGLRQVRSKARNKAAKTRDRTIILAFERILIRELHHKLVKKERVFIPKPKSAFLSGTCVKCGTENVFYSNSSREVKCKQCGEILATNTGGRVELTDSLSEEIKRLDYA
jgi:ribosomal protein S27E